MYASTWRMDRGIVGEIRSPWTSGRFWTSETPASGKISVFRQILDLGMLKCLSMDRGDTSMKSMELVRHRLPTMHLECGNASKWYLGIGLHYKATQPTLPFPSFILAFGSTYVPLTCWSVYDKVNAIPIMLQTKWFCTRSIHSNRPQCSGKYINRL